MIGLAGLIDHNVVPPDRQSFPVVGPYGITIMDWEDYQYAKEYGLVATDQSATAATPVMTIKDVFGEGYDQANQPGMQTYIV